MSSINDVGAGSLGIRARDRQCRLDSFAGFRFPAADRRAAGDDADFCRHLFAHSVPCDWLCIRAGVFALHVDDDLLFLEGKPGISPFALAGFLRGSADPGGDLRADVGFEVPYIVQVVLLGWNTWHVSRQNCGILSIYRSRAGVSNLEQKNAANNAILSVSCFLATWNIESHNEVMGFFGWFSTDLAWIMKARARHRRPVLRGAAHHRAGAAKGAARPCRELVPDCRAWASSIPICSSRTSEHCDARNAVAALRAVSRAGVVAASAQVRDREATGRPPP